MTPPPPAWPARLAALLALWLGLGGIPAPARAALEAGAAKVNITPPLGIEINGGTTPALATEVHDELQARALVLADGSHRLAFVVLDNCLIDRALLDQAKALIFHHTGIASNRVCLAATHTHSAGSLTGVHLAEPDESYRRWIPGRVSDAVRLAVRRLAPARAGWGSGHVPQHVFNRRIRVKPGVTYTNLLGRTGEAVKMNWSSPEPAVDDGFSAPVDPELFVLSVRHADGRPLAVLANYSLHYVGGVGPGHLSADYFGVFAERIGELLGAARQDPSFVGILCNGTSGDINNVDYRIPRPPQPPYQQIQRVAEDVAREAQRVIATLDHRAEMRLDAVSVELPLAVRKPTAEEAAQARALLRGRDRSQLRSWPEIYAREQQILAGYPDTLALPVQVFRVGDLAIAQWPGEIFAETGLALKSAGGPGPLFNISLANGWYGYIPPPRHHAWGAYETWRGRTSLLETNAIPRLLAAFQALLRDLR